MASCLILAYSKTHTFLAFTADFFLPIIALINETVLLLIIYYIFLIYVNKSLASSSFSILQLR